MPKAEVGSTKWIGNKMKAKGLQRLRWYCQICEKQCRDDNGFKQHTMSEGHVRAMLLVGEDPKRFINDYSRQFQHDFLQLLKVAHGEKKVHMNNFYQQYIGDKEHIHMNATKWPSLTEFAKHLGREGLCRVEEGERGLEIAFIDDSAAAIKRKEEVRRQMQNGDGDVEVKLLEEQIRKAKEAEEQRAAKAASAPSLMMPQIDSHSHGRSIGVSDHSSPEPFKMSFGLNKKPVSVQQEDKHSPNSAAVPIATLSASDSNITTSDERKPSDPPKMSFPLGSKKQQSVNPLSSKASKNPLKQKPAAPLSALSTRPMSNAERIMKDEIDRARLAEQRGGKRRRLE